LALLFKETCPSNENLVHVLLKVTALNQFYSTNIFDTYTVAKHIVGMNIGERLKAGDRALSSVVNLFGSGSARLGIVNNCGLSATPPFLIQTRFH
jgi:hypothetical protein